MQKRLDGNKEFSSDYDKQHTERSWMDLTDGNPYLRERI